jgi:hypothetical protein
MVLLNLIQCGIGVHQINFLGDPAKVNWQLTFCLEKLHWLWIRRCILNLLSQVEI